MKTLTASAFTLSLLASEASAQAASAASIAATPSVSSSLLQMFLALIGVLALLFACLWLLKKLTAQRGAAAGLLRVVAATAVGTRERVVIVEVGSTWLVLGVAPGQVSALAEIPRQPMAEPPHETKIASVPQWLQQLMKKG
ncbi:MAG: flagellar biosynthetic protein FliO [Rugosibacter sp.]|jgi:flagellar protein FliO/FliZ|nr:flagellar biosynthetic protein FliO [Rugosibacter sp.]